MPELARPKVSVCVPTYNRAPLLRPFLESILTQRFDDFEVLVADNCSTDGTAGILRAMDHPRMRCFRHEQNIGPFANMNFLIEQARGQYVCIAHDDDLYARDFLRRECDLLDEHPEVGMVHSAVWEIDADGTRRQIVRAYATTRVLNGKDEFVRYLDGHNVCCSSVMARAELYRANPFDSRFLCADFLMWMKFALAADVGYIADPLLEMRVHAETVTSWLNPMRWLDEFTAIQREGFALAVAAHPELEDRRDTLFKHAARAQGRRFLTAALAAISRGNFELARGYTAVLEKLRHSGSPATYAWLPRLLANGGGRQLLAALAAIRRERARRLAASLGDATVPETKARHA